MKSLMFIFLLPLCLSSCFPYQSISKREMLSAENIREKLKPMTIHWIELKTGQEIKLLVTNVDSTYIYGEIHEKDSYGFLVKYPYEDKLENLAKNASKISVRKFNPYLTAGIVLFPVIIVILYVNAGAGFTY